MARTVQLAVSAGKPVNWTKVLAMVQGADKQMQDAETQSVCQDFVHGTCRLACCPLPSATHHTTIAGKETDASSDTTCLPRNELRLFACSRTPPREISSH